jgi:hypothetical protein
MDFYTQTMVELIMALGGAMVVGNLFAILKRKRDKKNALESLKISTRTSKQTTQTMVKNQVAQGKATLAVAPIYRSVIFIIIGLLAFSWAAVTLLSS